MCEGMFDDMPKIKRCFGTFPPKYGSLIISWIGIASGGFGIAAIIIYGIMEKSIFANSPLNNVNPTFKAALLMLTGLSSVLLFSGSIFLSVAITFRKPKLAGLFVYFIIFMCFVLIVAAIVPPVLCIMEWACIFDGISLPILICVYLVLTAFVEIWMYFMIVGNQYKNYPNR